VIKMISALVVVIAVALSTTGCATARWHDAITSKQFADVRWERREVAGVHLGLSTKHGREYHEYVFPDPIWRDGSDLNVFIPSDPNNTEVIVRRAPHQAHAGGIAYANYFPPNWTSDRRQSNYSYLETNSPATSPTKYITKRLYASSYPVIIDLHLHKSLNGVSVQYGRNFGISTNEKMFLDMQAEFFVNKEEWSARNWSSQDNWYWCQWSPAVEVEGGLDPRKWRERLLAAGYVVTVPLDIVTLPVMWPFYWVAHELNWHE
jgi:hypothetical protein